jgi:P pilus assembly chaperone PapD
MARTSTRLIVLCLLAAVPAAAQIGISPARLELQLDNGTASGSLRVFNFGKEPVDVLVTVHNWDLTDRNKVRILPPTEQSLDQWLILSPLSFKLDPQGSQVVRLVVRPRVKPTPGEHRAIVYFKQAQPMDVKAGKATFKVGFRFGVAVYADAKPVVRKGVLHEVKMDGNVALFDIESEGNVHVRMEGQWAVWRADAYPGAAATTTLEALDQGKGELPTGLVKGGQLPTMPVLPGTRRTVRLELPLDLNDGRYVLDLNGRLAGAAIDEGLPFTWVPPTPTPTRTPAAKPTGAPPPTPTPRPPG